MSYYDLIKINANINNTSFTPLLISKSGLKEL